MLPIFSFWQEIGFLLFLKFGFFIQMVESLIGRMLLKYYKTISYNTGIKMGLGCFYFEPLILQRLKRTNQKKEHENAYPSNVTIR
jgi:hypothetical protein